MAKDRASHFGDAGMTRRWKYRLFPTKEQIEWFQQQFSGMRYIYNRILDFAEERRKETGKNQILAFSFASFKKEHPENTFVRGLLSNAVGYERIAVIAAYNNFFRRLEKEKKNPTGKKIIPPRHKSAKKDRNSFTFQASQDACDTSTKGSLVFDWEHNTVKIPKIGVVKANLHRRFTGYYSSATIYEDDGDYYISVVLELRRPEPLPKTGKAVGVDMGKRDNLVIPSEGEPYVNPKFGKAAKKRLRRLQKKFARQQRVLVPEEEMAEYEKSLGRPIYRDSARRAKTRRQIQKLHAHVKHQREDYAHNIAIDLIREYDIIGMENLNISGMLKNPKKEIIAGGTNERSEEEKALS